MIAKKDSPIWQAIADGAGGYEDTLGHPFPPFAFNSGMDWRAVPREEWESLTQRRGDAEAAEGPETGPMVATLAPTGAEVDAAFDRLSPDLQEELRRELAA
jgi:hypothetical protein